MAKSDITFPALRIVKKVRGYKNAVDKMTREVGTEFFNEYIMPAVKREFSKFEWTKNLKDNLIITIRKTEKGYKFTLNSEAENEYGLRYYKEVIEGKKQKKVNYKKLKQWVVDKIDPEEDEVNSITKILKEKFLESGSEPKPWVLINIKNQSDGLIHSELKVLLQRKMKALRRRYPKG